LSVGDVVVLDNASFHKDPNLREIAKEHGVAIIFLPAYSPDLNPIEKFWANLKRNIRKIIKKCKSLQEAITLAFELTISG
jgi:isftu1 transposase